MKMNDDTYLAHLTYQSVYASLLDKMEPKHGPAVEQLRTALQAADAQNPGFLLEMTKQLLLKSQLQVNMQEAFLRLQAQASTEDLLLSNRPEPPYQELSQRAINLRRILARIPDEMGDRRTFLETIKEIASSIKKLLDATNNIYNFVPLNAQGAVERRKKEFVHYSKRFSNTLKEYFKGEEANRVFISANQLIFQTMLIIRTVREKTRD